MKDIAGKRIPKIELPAEQIVREPDVLAQALKDGGVFTHSLRLLYFNPVVECL